VITGNLEAYGRQRIPPLNVNEIFGPVWQGEGPATGERCTFLRLANCNLDCGKGEGATWHCDTPYTWDWENHDRRKEVHPMAVDTVVDLLEAAMGLGTRLLVISGGEPLLQARALDFVTRQVTGLGISVDIETNGTRQTLGERIRRYVCSPKLANSGVLRAKRRDVGTLQELESAVFDGKAEQPTAFKFVATDPEDLAEVDLLVDDVGLTNVWIMPGGTSVEETLTHARLIAPAVAERGYNLSLRQQVLLHGDTRAT
jgi:7-carboxy-7-deazaguanine synthase